MKTILSLFIFSSLFIQPISGIYSFSMRAANGTTISLKDYKGKKIMFIVLSPAEKDPSVEGKLNDFQKKYGDNLIIIGIPSVELGCTGNDALLMHDFYAQSNPNIKITEPVAVMKTSSAQSPVFAWLTHKDQNKHFDTDVQGADHKFFIDEQGTLYAVMSSRQALDAPIINNIVNKTAPARQQASN